MSASECASRWAALNWPARAKWQHAADRGGAVGSTAAPCLPRVILFLINVKNCVLGKKVEPQIGEIVKKIKTLIEEKRVNDEELKKLQAHRGAMEKELDELNQEIFHLEGNCNTKEANLKRLRFQYEQSQAQTERKAFEQQLEELIGKHKWMAEFYTPARLELEMRNIENSKQQLLTEEHVMTEKLSTLDKELDSLQQQGAASDEVIFLHSKEAKLTQFQKEWESRRNIVVQRRDNDMDESEDRV
ncbi:synaptonemal complex central element protein 1-like isoform X6 [Cetorhinus maximus]